jgi:hypothetical protein
MALLQEKNLETSETQKDEPFEMSHRRPVMTAYCTVDIRYREI